MLGKAHRGLLGLLRELLLFVVGMELSVRAEDPVPPGERRGVVPDEVHVVEIVVPRARVEGDEVQGVEGNIVPTGKERPEIKQGIEAAQIIAIFLNSCELAPNSRSDPLSLNHCFGQGSNSKKLHVLQTTEVRFQKLKWECHLGRDRVTARPSLQQWSLLFYTTFSSLCNRCKLLILEIQIVPP